MLRIDGEERLGVVDVDGRRVLDVVRLASDVPRTGDALVRDEAALVRVQDVVAGADESAWQVLADVSLGPPLRRPGKIMAIGLNYRDHAEEQNLTAPEKPLIFAKFPTAIIGPYDDIVIPPASDKIDHEVELAVVIGKGGRMIREEDARRHVFGYAVLNDVTARDLQKSDRQWVRAKSFDTFCPLGPWLVTADEVEFPPERGIRCRVNGEERQSSNTRNLMHGVAALISYLSQAFTLEPGDIISTGTPSGVGVFRTPPVFLKAGDVVEADIDGIGMLRNGVV